MKRGGRERAVTIQIGAVLLLAIVFSALALYQVNAVPVQNEAVEISHNERVHDDVQVLRNEIRNAGTSGERRSASVTLGTQYPTRSFLTNPPDPSGTLETTDTRTIAIENATVDDPDDYEGEPANLLGEHDTTTIAYEPGYNEYDAHPTTRLEHGLAFNEFDDAAVALTEQPLIDDDRITVVVVDGELSETSTGAVSVDPVALSGPSDPVSVTGGLTLTIPTDSPSLWNETLRDDLEDAIANVDEDETNGHVTVELNADTYELQVARVGVGSHGGASDEFDVHRSHGQSDGPGENGDPAPYRTLWAETNPDDVVIEEGERDVALEMEADDDGAAVERASVSYAISDPDDVVDEFDRRGTTDADGRNQTTLEFDDDAIPADGSSVSVYVSSGASGDRHDLEVERASDPDPPDPSPVTTFESASVSDLVAGESGQSQEIAFQFDGTLEPGDEVEVDLGDAQSGSVDYHPQGTATVQSGNHESISFDTGGNHAELTYESAGDDAETEIRILLENVDADDGDGTAYDVDFDGPNETAETASFAIRSD
ncbi:hypothetical protein [Natrarchaeobius oligotrophus]|uniref:Secreted glycoprotein n=1 Tax=Natrarchaeobius chitinivorans TaxID=1679083 RepID=A0A3N6M3S7_NATCH|nr:hypothetical protein [Natrarchaeobius chitinivorans]RQG98133.1 hypothetical protein EA472_18370 [Natrarchaeobius chitinivorans]